MTGRTAVEMETLAAAVALFATAAEAMAVAGAQAGAQTYRHTTDFPCSIDWTFITEKLPTGAFLTGAFFADSPFLSEKVPTDWTFLLNSSDWLFFSAHFPIEWFFLTDEFSIGTFLPGTFPD
jgi:hypothetical protein